MRICLYDRMPLFISHISHVNKRTTKVMSFCSSLLLNFDPHIQFPWEVQRETNEMEQQQGHLRTEEVGFPNPKFLLYLKSTVLRESRRYYDEKYHLFFAILGNLFLKMLTQSSQAGYMMANVWNYAWMACN